MSDLQKMTPEELEYLCNSPLPEHGGFPEAEVIVALAERSRRLRAYQHDQDFGACCGCEYKRAYRAMTDNANGIIAFHRDAPDNSYGAGRRECAEDTLLSAAEKEG